MGTPENLVFATAGKGSGNHKPDNGKGYGNGDDSGEESGDAIGCRNQGIKDEPDNVESESAEDTGLHDAFNHTHGYFTLLCRPHLYNIATMLLSY